MTPNGVAREVDEPLEMLLRLVEQGKLEVTTISIAPITSAFISQLSLMTDRTPEELTEFVILGSRLVYIKSLALLPKDSAPEQSGEISRLNLELEEYRRMKAASAQLSKRQDAPTWTRPPVKSSNPSDFGLPTANTLDLRDALHAALLRYPKATPASAATRRPISQRSVADRLISRLREGSFNLESVFSTCESRLEIIVTFLALLEIIRQGKARVTQAGQFDTMLVEAPNV